MVKTLMIIGGGVEQVPAYEIAKKRGLQVVGTDMKLDAPALAFADHVLQVSTRDAEQTAEMALKFHKKHPIHGVMTIANDVPYTVALTANTLGLHSISLDAARCASDKYLMKKKFKEHKIDCPWFSEVESVDHLKQLTQDRNRKKNYVLKPVDGCGARGVLLIDDQVDLKWAYKESKSWSKSGKLIIENFISGLQLSTESFIISDSCYTPAIAERNYSRLNEFRPNIIEDGGTIPAQITERQRLAIDRLVLDGARALGITSGIVKGDLVIDDDGNPYIIELAARLSGGWLATHQIPAATGVHLVDAVISYALNETVSSDDLTPKWQHATAIRYWFPDSGKISIIRGEEKLKTIPGMLKYGFFRKPGDFQPKVHTHPDRFGFVIVEGKTRSEVMGHVKKAITSLTVEVE